MDGRISVRGNSIKSIVQKWACAEQILLFHSCYSAGVTLVGLMTADVPVQLPKKNTGCLGFSLKKRVTKGLFCSVGLGMQFGNSIARLINVCPLIPATGDGIKCNWI